MKRTPSSPGHLAQSSARLRFFGRRGPLLAGRLRAGSRLETHEAGAVFQRLLFVLLVAQDQRHLAGAAMSRTSLAMRMRSRPARTRMICSLGW